MKLKAVDNFKNLKTSMMIQICFRGGKTDYINQKTQNYIKCK